MCAARAALMVAVADDVGKRLLARFRREFSKVEGDPMIAAMELVRLALPRRDRAARVQRHRNLHAHRIFIEVGTNRIDRR